MAEKNSMTLIPRLADIARTMDSLERRCMDEGFPIAARGVNRAKQALGWEAANELEHAVRALDGKRPGEV